MSPYHTEAVWLSSKEIHMKNNMFFDKVKDYFKSSIDELKTDKTYQKKFIIVSCIEFLLLAFTIALDLWSKEYLYDFWKQNGNFTVIKGFLDITYSENTGAAFGSFSGGTLALTIMTTIIITAVLGYLLVAKRNDIWLRISLVFIAGGGIGNLVDRIGLQYVRDFFEFTFTTKWGIFNVADCFVSVGSVMMVIYLIYMLVKEGKAMRDQKNADNDESGNLIQSNSDNSVDNVSDFVAVNDGDNEENLRDFEDESLKEIEETQEN